MVLVSRIKDFTGNKLSIFPNFSNFANILVPAIYVVVII